MKFDFLSLFFFIALTVCPVSHASVGPCEQQEWTHEDSRPQGGSWIWFPGKWVHANLQVSYEKAEGMALDRLEKECGGIHSEVKFHERCDAKIGNVSIAYVRASITHEQCRVTKNPSKIKTIPQNQSLLKTLIAFREASKVKVPYRCTLEHSKQCPDFALYNYSIGKYEESLSFADIGCQKKNSVACFVAGLIFEDRNQTEKANSYYLHSCSLKYASACWNIARNLKAQGNLDEAVKFYEKGCALNDLDSCAMYGVLLLQKDSNNQTGNKSLAKACNDTTGNSGLGCTLLGVSAESDKDLVEAKTFYQKACLLNYGAGCFNLGLLLQKKNAQANLALENFKKACDLNLPVSCFQLGALYEGQKDKQTASSYFYKKGCNLGHPDSYANLGVTEWLKNKNSPDVKWYLYRSCSLGRQDICEKFKIRI